MLHTCVSRIAKILLGVPASAVPHMYLYMYSTLQDPYRLVNERTVAGPMVLRVCILIALYQKSSQLAGCAVCVRTTDMR